jgi:t-SNARE complex subunit (syntaxin)
VFASAAVRSAPNPLGATIPHADRPAENVVEPLRYCLELIDVVADQSRIVEARRLHREANIAVERHEQSQRQVVTKSWTIFAIAMVLLFAVVGVVTWFVVSQRA